MGREFRVQGLLGWLNRPLFLRWGLPLIALAASCLLYAKMLFAGFVWDDTLVQRGQMTFFRTFRDAFHPPHYASELFRSFYRPVVTLSYMLDRAIAGTGTEAAASWAHAVNVLCHAVATALVYLLALRLFAGHRRRLWAAFATALLFAVHPVHAESVCFIAGRGDIFAAIFVLATARCVLFARDSARFGPLFAVLAGCLFFLGMLSKEVTIAALAVIPGLLHWVPAREDEKADPRRGTAISVLMGVLLLAGVGGYFGLRAWGDIHFGTWASYGFVRMAGSALSAFGYYLLKVVVPWPQYHYVSKLPSLWAALPPVALALAAACWAWRKAGESRSLALLSLLWLTATILPSLAVSMPTMAVTPVAERYLYLPSVGIALLLGLWTLHADFSRAAHKAGLGAAALLIVAYSASVVERTGVWQGDVEFWTEAVRNPDAVEIPLVLSNLAEALQTAGRYDEARHWYGKAYDLFTDPTDRTKIMANLGAMELKAGRERVDAGNAAAALAHFDRGIGSLEPVFLSSLHMDGPPNASMGFILLLKHKALLMLGGKGNASLLERADRHFKVARYTIRDRPDIDAALAEIRQLQGPR